MKKIPSASTFDEVLGWYGMAAVLGAYALVTFGAITPDGMAFTLLNLTGAAGLCRIAYRKQAWQPATLNAIWFFIALAALARTLM